MHRTQKIHQVPSISVVPQTSLFLAALNNNDRPKSSNAATEATLSDYYNKNANSGQVPTLFVTRALACRPRTVSALEIQISPAIPRIITVAFSSRVVTRLPPTKEPEQEKRRYPTSFYGQLFFHPSSIHGSFRHFAISTCSVHESYVF